MLSNTYTARHSPLRHPDNANLHLHYGETFEGFPIQAKVGPFALEYLYALKHTIDLALAEYPRVLAFRVDLYVRRRQKLSATPDLSGTVLPLCHIPNSALKNAPPSKSATPRASACAGLLA